jgi:hypothetical protein
MLIAMLQKGYTDSYEFITFLLILLCFLTVLLIISKLFDWLRTEPWKRRKPPENGLDEGETPTISNDIPEVPDSHKNLLIDGTRPNLLTE